MALDYGNYGIFLVMRYAGFISSSLAQIVLFCTVLPLSKRSLAGDLRNEDLMIRGLGVEGLGRLGIGRFTNRTAFWGPLY